MRAHVYIHKHITCARAKGAYSLCINGAEHIYVAITASPLLLKRLFYLRCEPFFLHSCAFVMRSFRWFVCSSPASHFDMPHDRMHSCTYRGVCTYVPWAMHTYGRACAGSHACSLANALSLQNAFAQIQFCRCKDKRIQGMDEGHSGLLYSK